MGLLLTTLIDNLEVVEVFRVRVILVSLRHHGINVRLVLWSFELLDFYSDRCSVLPLDPVLSSRTPTENMQASGIQPEDTFVKNRANIVYT